MKYHRQIITAVTGLALTLSAFVYAEETTKEKVESTDSKTETKVEKSDSGNNDDFLKRTFGKVNLGLKANTAGGQMQQSSYTAKDNLPLLATKADKNKIEVLKKTQFQLAHKNQPEVLKKTQYQLAHKNQIEVLKKTQYQLAHKNQIEVLKKTQYQLAHKNQIEVLKKTQYQLADKNDPAYIKEVNKLNQHSPPVK
jgi:hypothetical protein